MLKLLAFVLPLGLDSFAVAAAIGAIRKTTVPERLRISLVFVVFEGGMPLIGLALGSALARGIGQVADYLAAAAVISIGAWMLLAVKRTRRRRPPAWPAATGRRLSGWGSASAWTSWPSGSAWASPTCPPSP